MSQKIFEKFNEKRRNEFKKDTDIDVPLPEELIHNSTVFEKMERNEIVEIVPGVQLEKGSFILDSEGSFVNYYDISIDNDNKNVAIDLFSTDKPVHLKRSLQNTHNTVVAVNGGFFYLSDKYNESPKNSNYQLNIRKDGIHGLPVADRPFLFLKNNELRVEEIKAHGMVSIDNFEYTWRGSRSNHKADVVLYTSASTVITQELSPSTGVRRVSVPTFTPKTENMIDVVIDRDVNGILRVQSVLQGGESNVQDGLGVFQMPSHIKIQKGMSVKIPNIDNIELTTISAGFCIGPNVFYFLDQTDHEINHDQSLGGNPAFGTNRIARHVIYKDTNNKIHTRLFDGIPGSKICKGITPQEVARIFEKMSIEWAYHLDGGQSAKLVIKEIDTPKQIVKIKSYGNKHYVRWPKNERQPFLWDPDGGRKVPSCIQFKMTEPTDTQSEEINLDEKYHVGKY